jgi:hypothetical protein
MRLQDTRKMIGFSLGVYSFSRHDRRAFLYIAVEN